MTAPADPAGGTAFSLSAFLRDELGLGAAGMAPGRPAAIARITVNCTVVVALAMLYEIPLPAYMAYIVFLISQREAASTLLTGVVGALAATVAVALSLLFYTLDAGEPALRLPLMALAAFTGMFLVRTSALGPVAFLAGFVLVLSQTLIDGMPTLEALTRLVLWLWVVVMVPATLTVLVNLVVGEDPADLARTSALRVMNGLAAALRDGGGTPLDRHQAQAVALIELHQRAGLLNRDLRRRAAGDQALIEILAELLTLYALLPGDTPAAVRRELADVCDGCALAFVRSLGVPARGVGARGVGAGGGQAVPPPFPPVLGEAALRDLTPAQRPVVVALADALARLVAGMEERIAGVPAAVEAPRPARSLFVPDAFSNPAHTRFALKTTLAVMAAYIIYSGLDWRGISTSVTTCFFVALGTLGETVHKLTLRLSGAVIGGALGGVCVVWVLPLMTDIGQLCLLIAAVSALCAWVATSSQRLSYAGMQIAFAFFLGVLQGYGPSTDLTVLRDRVAGILLGNVLITLVFSLLWPTSALDRARACLAAALRALGRLLADATNGDGTGGDGNGDGAGRRLAVIRALADTRHLVAVAVFEQPLLRGHPVPPRPVDTALGPLHRLAAAVFTVVDQRGAPSLAGGDGEGGAALSSFDAAAAAWLDACADDLAGGGGPLPVPPVDFLSVAALTADAPPLPRAACEARLLLRAEMDNVAAVIP